MEHVQELARIIEGSSNIVFFGGAGVSTASGIPDFRSADGIFSQRLHRSISPEELVSHTFYVNHPEEFFRFYREKLLHPDAKPNPCHLALARLEALGKVSAVVTQNIDGLHQAAGSQTVWELHGSAHRNYCERCRRAHDLEHILATEGVSVCEGCGGRVKPDVVLYGESLEPEVLTGAVQAIRQADTLIIGGTSLAVYPAAGLIQYFRGKHTVLINKGPVSAQNRAMLVIREDIAAVFSAVMEALDAA